MNATRKKRLGEALDIIEQVIGEEEEAAINLPENFEAKREQLEENIDRLGEARDALLDIIT